MLSLFAEWTDAPGVRDPVLAATWARLELKAGSPSESKWISRLIRATTNGLDRGIYGSTFPLAQWIVENWWFLLHESCRTPVLASGRQLASDPTQRAWAQRHNLLAAREGGALPDLTIFRDGDMIHLIWAADPEHDERIWPVRFIEQGVLFADPSDVERSLRQFVESVLDRLNGSSDDAAERLRANWKAVCESIQEERDLCASSAALGIDPYDEEGGLTDSLIDVLRSRAGRLCPELQQDLLDTTTAESLTADLDWLEEALSTVSVASEPTNGASPTSRGAAHDFGYERAAQFRRRFSLPQGPIADLPSLLHERCGWPSTDRQTVSLEGTSNVSALVAKDRHDQPRIVGPSLAHWAERFRLARSLYFVPDAAAPASPRLVTRAYSWDQRASRAFAAELLAPAESLREQVNRVVSGEDVDRLSRQFDVRPTVIEHQIENHRLAWIGED